MAMTQIIPETPPDYDKARILERPDGFYWQSKTGDEDFGPFATFLEAIQDMQYREDTAIDADESLAQVEANIGIAEWIDPETGEPAEDNVPRLEEH
jgi:hypothetical protein